MNPIIVNAEVELNDLPVDAEAESSDLEIEAEGEDELRPMPAISIGEVQEGDEAAATMTGSYAFPVLNLVLPRGPRGTQGPEGPQGPAGADYVLTSADKSEIATIVLGELPIYNGGVE